MGGNAPGRGGGIAVDGSGNACVTGYTAASDFPTVNACQPTFGGGYDAFVTKIDAGGTALLYSTYLGGSGLENRYPPGYAATIPPGGLALDGSGNIYVTGFTQSTNFPTKNALQPTYGGGSNDAFLAKIDPSQAGAASLVYSTYLGGSDDDEGFGIAVRTDPFGSAFAYVAGTTASGNFPTRNAFQPRNNGGRNSPWDAFVAKIGP